MGYRVLILILIGVNAWTPVTHKQKKRDRITNLLQENECPPHIKHICFFPSHKSKPKKQKSLIFPPHSLKIEKLFILLDKYVKTNMTI